jgi:hypothetical protein
MKTSRKRDFADVLAGFLNHCMLISLPEKRQGWGRALISEQQEIATSSERLAWAIGGIGMSTSEFIGNVFENWRGWLLGTGLALGAALLDLRSTTRWPHVTAMCLIPLFLTLVWPKWAWRWTLLVALVLPTFVLLSNEWGPYSQDRFDVFYGLVPAALGTFGGTLLRKAARWQQRPL